MCKVRHNVGKLCSVRELWYIQEVTVCVSNYITIRKVDVQWICCWFFVKHWCIGKEKVSSNSLVKVSMVCWGLEFLIYHSVTYIFCAIGVHHCFVIVIITIIL